MTSLFLLLEQIPSRDIFVEPTASDNTKYDQLIYSFIESASAEEMYRLIEQVTDLNLIRQIIAIRFFNEARLDNDDLKNPFIIWEAMNREPQSWIALAIAKVAKKELNIQDGDAIFTIPSSGTWLEPELRKMFPNSIFPVLKKEKGSADISYAQFDVLSHSNSRAPRTMFLCSDPSDFLGRRIVIFDDVVARGDALKGVSTTLREITGGNTNITAAAVMDKTMQREKNVDLGVDKYSRLFAVDKVENYDGAVSFILS